MKKLLLFTLVLFTALFSIQTASAQHWAQVKTEADELKGTRAQSAQYIKVPGEGMAFLNDKTDAHESFHELIIDDEDDLLGFIDLLILQGDDVYDRELVVGYKDMDGFCKEEKKHTDDL